MELLDVVGPFAADAVALLTLASSWKMVMRTAPPSPTCGRTRKGQAHVLALDRLGRG